MSRTGEIIFILLNSVLKVALDHGKVILECRTKKKTIKFAFGISYFLFFFLAFKDFLALKMC